MPGSKRIPNRIRTRPLDASVERVAREAMRKTGTPGVAVGILLAGRAYGGGFGITSIAAPAPVDEQTLFQIGSTSKTFTATAVQRLVERGDLDLDAPVRRYLRDLRLKDPQVARTVTLRHLLTHTAGWVGDYFADTGRGDDALARVITHLATVPQLTPLGEVWHYNNAGFYLLGRVIEKTTGAPYERAIAELLLQPLGMTRSFFFADEAIPYRVAAGHMAVGPTKTKHTLTPQWAMARNVGPAGGLISDVIDQLRWAQFHMGDGRAPDGKRLLKRSSLREMQRPQSPAADMADATGLTWLIEDVGGVRTVAHGGTTPGQLSAFLMVPEHDFAVTVLTNSSRGREVHRALVRHALEHFLGVARPVVKPLGLNGARLDTYPGTYVSGLGDVAIDLEPSGTRLAASFRLLKGDHDPGFAPFKLAFHSPDIVEIVGGRLGGARAHFLRDPNARVRFLRFGGRLYKRARAQRS